MNYTYIKYLCLFNNIVWYSIPVINDYRCLNVFVYSHEYIIKLNIKVDNNLCVSTINSIIVHKLYSL